MNEIEITPAVTPFSNFAQTLGSISPIFYTQLLCAQIPKAQKYSQAISLFALLGSGSVKAVRKMLVKSTPGHGPSICSRANLVRQKNFKKSNDR